MAIDAVHTVRTARIVRTRNRIDQQRIHHTGLGLDRHLHFGFPLGYRLIQGTDILVHELPDRPIDSLLHPALEMLQSEEIEHIGFLDRLQCRSFVGIGDRGKGILEATGYSAAYRYGIRHHDIELRHHGLPAARSESQSGKNKKKENHTFHTNPKFFLNKI